MRWSPRLTLRTRLWSSGRLRDCFPKMIFDILTIFPGIFKSPLAESLLGKALNRGLIEVRVINLRDFTEDKHRLTDDYPYGGGAGMVMKPEPIIRAVEEIKNEAPDAQAVLLTPQGKRLDQKLAREMRGHKRWF